MAVSDVPADRPEDDLPRFSIIQAHIREPQRIIRTRIERRDNHGASSRGRCATRLLFGSLQQNCQTISHNTSDEEKKEEKEEDQEVEGLISSIVLGGKTKPGPATIARVSERVLSGGALSRLKVQNNISAGTLGPGPGE